MRDLIDLITVLSEDQSVSAAMLIAPKNSKRFKMPVIGKVEKMQRLANAGNGKARAATYADTDLIGFALEDKDTTTHDEIEIIQYPRFEALISAILTKQPLELSDGSTVVVDPDEADRLEGLVQTGDFKGAVTLRLANGEEIRLGQLAKTSRFGGQALGGTGEQELGKESVLVKPSQIDITDVTFPASQLGQKIVNNEVLKSTDYGKSVIEMAETILEGQNPEIPQEYSNKVKSAILDYAGEYLGVLALLEGVSEFVNLEDFESWLGGSISDLDLNFPGKTNVPLADSFAIIRNKKTNHSISISSKRDKGAAPSLGKLKIPDEVKNDPELKGAVEFIELCQDDSSLPKPLSISSIFAGMNILYEADPSSISNKFNAFLPWNVEQITDQVKDSINSFKEIDGTDPIPKKYEKLWKDINFSSPSSNGGKLAYAVKKEVMEAINERNALPGFRESVLLTLNMNFIQQYAKPKRNVLTFETFWPARIRGQVTLESKGAATDPTKGGFSFRVSPEAPKTKLEMPDETGLEASSDIEVDQDDFKKTAAAIAKGTTKTQPTKSRPVGDVGRKKR